MKRMLAILLVLATVSPLIAAEKESKASKKSGKALSFNVKDIQGDEVELTKYKDKVVLVVNVASQCGLTDSNYKGLQEIYKKYKGKGFEILAFPCNQFGKQEPGDSKQITEFCSNKYGVTFPLFEKIEVNGDGANPLYKYLTSVKTKPAESGTIKWNFEKFLIGRDGEVVARFEPRVKPDSKEIVSKIEEQLSKK